MEPRLVDRWVLAACQDERTALVLERVGWLTMADKADGVRTQGDVLAIALPPLTGRYRTRRIRVHRHDGADPCVAAFYRGGWRGYEPPLPDVFVRVVRATRGHVLDVGANTGVYALLAAAARADAQVHAFEPFPPVQVHLVENIALNHRLERIAVVRAAADHLDGTSTLHVPRAIDFVETSCSLDGTFKEDLADPVTVDTIRLDTYWRDVGRPPVAVIKIDTEGTEHRVLAGAHELVERHRPVIFLEVLPRAALDELRAFADRHALVDVVLSPWEAVVGRAVEHDPHAWNHALVPTELVELVRTASLDAGLVVTDLRDLT